MVRSSDHLILEIDLNAAISRDILTFARKHGKPVYGIPGNLSVILPHMEMLDDLQCFICNDVEAEKLLQTPFTGLEPEACLAPLRTFVDARPLRSMVVTLGANGSIFYDSATGVSGHQPVFPVRMVDSSGAGDAFISGTVTGLIRGLPLEKAVIAGTKVAGWTIESPESNCPDLKEKAAGDGLFGG
ncbi:PfkB family carbohydrate kinase [Paenibacillus sp. CC-CFT747]|nr:PfkB family carbohydrate kinase [Paenibacillus sp. CC-CFT747]